MFKIVKKEKLNDDVTRMAIEAPLIAEKGKAGQFIIFRVDELGERIPLTIAGTNKDEGTVDIIFQTIGKGTRVLANKEEGEYILDFVGPLGIPSALEGHKRACVIGGGVGTAIAYPSAVELHNLGSEVDVIVGFRNKDIVILEDEFRAASDNLYMMTDDGSYGEHGFVTKKLEDLLEAGVEYDVIVAIGPVPMMKAVVELTKPKGIKTLVSLNPIMVDGTGMCGCCRVVVDGELKFACVDGPEFDGFEVDFDDLTRRNRTYIAEEEARDHECRAELAAKKADQ
ncbi:MAG: sulfide/dihydroorotate dehydrogenase-like FAD/NAD-binding protein [Clostridiaceae bacterium]|jgi:ferredoxin--NADP+ reductase|nr:sulfide/dihydroorotate dehydrogenase-like FAD/NAD-binding protein [Bacillota bacterium]NLN51983.1 sulfide/dihydroorotate dehydrogenase-like FAD/NAD-binding protein [Clostridiaceae bacterium]